MNILAATAIMLTGLGMSFVGIRTLSANLVPLAGRRTRAAFAVALRGPFSTAVSGFLAGLVTQSAAAVSWVVLGFVRSGVLVDGPALMAPAWSNVGSAALPLIVAVDTTSGAGLVIGLVGFAIYSRLDRTDRTRYILEALLGAALLLYGLHLVSSTTGLVRAYLLASRLLSVVTASPWILGAVGLGLGVVAQSSSVAAALAVAVIGSGLLTLPEALPLIAGANAASMLNNLLRLRGENFSGRVVFALQALQKAAGSAMLILVLFAAGHGPILLGRSMFGWSLSVAGQVAVLFAAAQFVGAVVSGALQRPVEAALRAMMPPDPTEALAKPVFLLPAALDDPRVALDLVVREIVRLAARLPNLLDGLRTAEAGDGQAGLAGAGLELGRAIKTYLTRILDEHPSRTEVAATLMLEAATGNLLALHEDLAEFQKVGRVALVLPTAGSLIEALHALLSTVADYAATLDPDDFEMTLQLLGDREAFMQDLRQRLASAEGADADVQDALFRMTVLFERTVWLARRTAVELSQAMSVLAAG